MEAKKPVLRMKKKDLPGINVMRAIFEAMEDGVLAYDLHYKIVYCNRAAEAILGYPFHEIAGKEIFVLVPPQLRKEHLALFEKVRAGEKVAGMRTRRVGKGGRLIPVSVSACPVRDLHDHVVGGTDIIRDISGQKQAEERDEMLSSIIDHSDDGIITTTADGYINSWNKGAERLFGYSAEEAAGRHISMLVPAERRMEEEGILARIGSGDEVHYFHSVRVTKSGQLIPVSLARSSVKDAEGNVIGMSSIARNISSQRVAEEKQAILASIVENSDDAIISKTLEGIITTWNLGAERIFGYTAAEAIGRHITILIPPERLAEETTIIESIRRGEKIDHFQTVRLHKNGTEIDISLTVSPVKDSAGVIIGASKIARDITRQKKALEAVRRNAERLEVLHSVGKTISEKLDVDLILKKVVDATTVITGAAYGIFFYNEVNGQGETKTLSATSGVAGAAFPTGNAGGSPDLQRIFRRGRVIRSGDMCRDVRYLAHQADFIVPADYPLVMSYLAVPVISGNGMVTGGLFFGHALPAMFNREHEHLVASLASQASVALENSRLFEEVSRLSRKKDEFIALASHELKTPITTLKGFLQLLEQEIGEEGSAGFFVKKALGQLEKLTNLINDLLDVSKIQAGKLQLRMEEFEFGQFMKETIETYRRSISSHRIRLDLQGSYMIAADKIRLEQVMANLINNAVKYSPDADAIDIYVKEQGNEIAVSVKDYGLGISKENLQNIFSRFYWADNVHRISGLGLGLYVSKEIIERHGGRIWIESDPGEGSVFTFTVPFSGS